jgi:hypothetical protein
MIDENVDSMRKYGVLATLIVYTGIGFAMWVGFSLAKFMFSMIGMLFS